MDLHFLTIAQASRLLRDRKLSPVELTQAFLDRIASLDPQLNAYLLPLPDQALAAAKRAEQEIAGGGWKGALHGIPIGLKDIYNTVGIRTTGHSALFKDHVPTDDAFTVQCLRDAGAVILGKLSTWEFAIGGASFDLPWPPARNPWNPAQDPGGSSSGSGAAVASGLAMAAMGTDTGGSIRGPASWCGIAGHKPTYGYVSRRGVLPLSFSLDHAGPMCWTAEDCALMMQVLARHDPLDAGSAAVPVPDFAAALGGGLAGVRIGVPRHFFEHDLICEPEVLAAFNDAMDVFRSLGATISDITLSPLGLFTDINSLITAAEAYAIHRQWLQKTPELYGERGRLRIMAGAFVQAADYVNAQRERTRLTREVASVMADVDLLMMPTRQMVAPVLGGYDSAVGPSLTRPFNMTGFPALSICNGFAASGLPTSLQIAGRPFQDHIVLRAGDAFEQTTALRTRRPPLFSTPLVSAAAD
ncbi:amidase [Rhodopila sp.]|uniref:amidase n=1 Tax=Rhodopila sp. TaxID=2480087 RepID=UPI003D0D4CA3